MLRRVVVPVILALALPLLGACGGADPTEVRSPAEVAEAIDDGALLLDVRTPEETAGGVLPSAVVVDAQDEGFDDAVAALDPDESYVVYCASGRRAAAAIERMQDAGIDDVVNGGGYEDLVADTAVREVLQDREAEG